MAGFSLIEMSILLAVIGMLTVTLLTSGLLGREKYRLTETEEKMEKILTAIQVYYNRTGYLPCPAPRTDGTNTTNLGMATNCGAAAPAGVTDTLPTGGVDGNDNVRIGIVPTRTLALPDSYLYDEWGTRFSYVVVKKLATDSTSFTSYTTALTSGVIEILDEGGTPNATSVSEVNGFVLLSHGADRKGAYSKQGNVGIACGTADIDALNCDNDARFVDISIDENQDTADANTNFTGTSTPFFYDIVRTMKTAEIVKSAANASSSSTSSTSGADPVPPDPAATSGNGDGSGSGSGSSGGGPGGSPRPAVAARSCNLSTQVEVAADYTCALSSDSRAYCWGKNDFGELGIGTLTSPTVPTEVSGGFSDWVQVRGDGDHTCGVRAIGSETHLYCWGDNTSGQLGNGAPGTHALAPVIVSGGYTNWVKADVDANHTCGLRANGRLFCWGENTDGRLGDGTTVQRNVPVEVSGNYTNWENFSTASRHSCGLRGGRLFCWGSNTNGQLGDGTNVAKNTPTEVFGGHTDWAHYSSNHGQGCGLRSGRVFCWGAGTNGALGTGSTTASNVPVEVSGSYTDWTYIVAGTNNACGLRGEGRGYCWGLNNNGQLGDGTTTNRLVPTQIQGGHKDYTHLSIAGTHSCAVRESKDQFSCWGNNTYGQLGDGTTTNALAAVDMQGIEKFTCNFGANCSTTFVEAAGGNQVSYALMPDGNAYVWGSNTGGVFGDGTTTSSTTPRTMGTHTDWYAMNTDSHENATCGIRKNGRLYCWGNRTYGRIGDGGATTGTQLVPVEVRGGYNDWVEVAIDHEHACARRGYGNLYCWGRNISGKLGISGGTDPNMPTQVTGNFNDWSDIDIGVEHSCGIRNDGEAYCWGENSTGQLGDGTNTMRSAPTLVSGGVNDWKWLGTEHRTTCAVTHTGRGYCWGRNDTGTVGDGTTTSRNVPTEISGAHTDWSFIRGGIDSACGRRAGNLYCWGARIYGQVADGGALAGNQLTPSLVANGITDWIFVNPSWENACASTVSGKVYCWGRNEVGQVGDGTLTQRTVPTFVEDVVNSCNAIGGACVLKQPVIGTDELTCAVDSNGKAYCWGRNDGGQAGTGTTGADVTTPTEVSGGHSDWYSIENDGNLACGIRQVALDSGTLHCWGKNSKGQIGNGTTTDSSVPALVSGGYSNWSYIAVENQGACGLRSTGHAYCWGWGIDGQIGDGGTSDRNVPTLVSGGHTNWINITTGNGSSCGVRGTADVGGTGWCWGDNAAGKLGNGTTTNSLVPVAVAGGFTDWKTINSSGSTYCGLRATGQAYCWGQRSAGSIGDGVAGGGSVTTPTEVSGGHTDWSLIVSGNSQACGIRSGGKLFCWGLNSHGQIGNGNTTNQLTPTLVSGGHNDWISVAAANRMTCGTRENKKMYCWGQNNYHQIGDGTMTPSSVPVELPGFTGAASNCESSVCRIDIKASYNLGFAINYDGTPYAWGNNSGGVFGDGTTLSSPSPVPAATLYDDWVKISSDYSGYIGCGIRENGRLYCWGTRVGPGYLGDGLTTTGTQLTPVEVSGNFSDWVDFEVGGHTTCGLRASGRLYCWGENHSGQIGDGSTTHRTVPTEVSGSATDWISIGDVEGQVCGVRGAGTSGTLYCWGQNGSGQLGRGTTGGNFSTPQLVNGGFTDWVRAGGKGQTTCGLRAGGTAYCWGKNTNGGIGDGTTTNRNVPTPVSGSYTDWNQIVAGDHTTCGMRTNGTIWCWGSNVSGQIGDGSTTNRTLPTLVSGSFTDWIRIDTTGDAGNTCGARENGKYYCWGSNANGQIGDGTTTDSLTPKEISGIDGCSPSNVSICSNDVQFFIRPGKEHSHAVNSNGRGYSWGNNADGHLGDGTTTDSLVPVEISGGYTDWITIDSDGGINASCGLRKNGTVWCWGNRQRGVIGDGGATTGNQLTPVQVSGGFTDWNKLSVDLAACGLRKNGRAYCWGGGDDGRLGNGATTDVNIPTELSGAYSDWTYIQTGYNTGCGIRNNGEAWCWGNNTNGSVGMGTAGGTFNTPQLVAGGHTDWVSIDGNSATKCGLRKNGRAYCWGTNANGSIGDGTTGIHRPAPTEVSGAHTDWTTITASEQNGCGIRSGQLYCWGHGNQGALGNGGTANSLTPTLVSGGHTDWKYVASGRNAACGVRTGNEKYYCWGDNATGQLGDGTTTDRLVPTAVLDLTAPGTENCLGSNCTPPVHYRSTSFQANFGCAISSESRAYCWGGENAGQLGNGGPDASSTVPVEVNGAYADWKMIDTSEQAACGVRKSGQGYCWGRNTSGKLGDGTTANKDVPTLISTYNDWSYITTGKETSCGLRKNGRGYCWGDNTYGAIGDGTNTQRLTPTEISGAHGNWDSVVAGDNMACGIRVGALYCWGRNGVGQLGRGTTGGTFNTPQLVAGGHTNWTLVVNGNGLTCGLRTGRAFCWGDNTNGYIGDGTTTNSNIPVEVSGAYTDWQTIASNINNACGIRSGRAYCWGDRSNDRIGDGGSNSGIQLTPALVGGNFVDFVFIDTTSEHTCGIRQNGDAYCWGLNTYGEYGIGNTTSSVTPVRAISGLSLTVPAECGGEGSGCVDQSGWLETALDFSCAIDSEKRGWCWGGNAVGQLGNGTVSPQSTVPVEISGGHTDWKMVTTAASDYPYACGLRSANGVGRVYCWGNNTNGVLGDGTTVDKLVPTEIAGGFTDWSRVDAGGGHACALRKGGKLYCWSSNFAGQLGDGTLTNRIVPTEVAGAHTTWTYVGLGYKHSCAIRSGRLHCWGEGYGGRLGTGTATSQSTPTLVTGGYVDWVSVSSTNDTTCGLRASGQAYCWGENAFGEAGNGATGQLLSPVEISGNYTDWKYIYSGHEATCGIRNGMRLFCWGNNTNGALGDGTTINRWIPTPVKGEYNDYTSASIHATAACALRESSGRYYCWGQNYNGQLGNGTYSSSLTPVTVAGMSGATCQTEAPDLCTQHSYFIRPGRERSHGIDESGRGYSWGRNVDGGLGNGTTTDSLLPVEIAGGITDWITIDTDGTSSRASCGLRASGTIWCWGSRMYGNIGDGGPVGGNQLIPVQIAGGHTDWTMLSTDLHSCALRATGQVYCWGNGQDGALGDGAASNRTVPTQVSGNHTDWSYIQSGGYHSCGIRNGGELYCWGDNTEGTLGIGALGGSYNTPQLVTGGHTDWKMVHGNSLSRCGIRSNRRAYCWGDNEYGKLGDGTNVSRAAPTEVTGAYTDWEGIATANENGCGIRNNGRMYCWGRGFYGALGNGSLTSSWVPVEVSGGHTDWTYVAAGGSIACGLRSNSATFSCWGDNEYGELGDGTTVKKLVPTQVQALSAPYCPTESICAEDVQYFIRPGKEWSHAVDSSGRGYSWGRNNHGGLGNGTFTDSLTPVEISGGFTDWLAIDSDGQARASCGLRASGTIWCWGGRVDGSLGDGGSTTGNQTTPVQIAGGYTDWVGMSTDLHSCAVRANGRAYCWGMNTGGQLGDGTYTSRNVPTEINGMHTDWTSIQVGDTTSCGIRGTGVLYCWGNHDYGKVGHGAAAGGNFPTPQLVSGGFTDWTMVHGNSAARCGLRANGRAYCWGINFDGQVGDGTTTHRNAPVEISGAHTDWAYISTANENTCGIRAGALYCWGNGAEGSNGTGVTTSYLTPQLVAGGYTDWTYVATGGKLACGVRRSSSVYYCWGDNEYGELGDGTTTDRLSPTPVYALTTPNSESCQSCSTDFYTGKFYGHALSSEGKAFGWGDNSYGGLGNNTTTDSLLPVQVSGNADDWVMIDSEGSDPTCGLRTNGKIYCWGARFNGSIGDGGALNGADQLIPAEVAGGYNDWSRVSSDHHSCGLRSNGRAYCWGTNDNGRLGDGTTLHRGSPTEISGTHTDWNYITAGGSHSCGIRGAGTMYCWGLGTHGALGNSGVADSHVPALVSGGYTDWKNVHFRSLSTCGLRLNGRAYCWGKNTDGQLGDGTTTDRSIPTEINGAHTDWTYIASGDQTSCGLRTSGRIYCWGDNADGGLGDGSTPLDSLTPIAVAGGYTDWTHLAVGASNACGIRSTTGRLYCWGKNTDGQLGDGTTSNHSTPAAVPSFIPCGR